ncbi:kinase-like protein [Cylindrobasidium torrendii FP15055 ss-10]|uniref:mitogen-activated protein kinase n=1 Tax=Cylindrobasidium torrendii FP15055 ss-10 TaxID=1314674 RepID=A0A0D7AXA1_9AGAR|nr:kinase-like protein [Cylindrobasidium torrendii FP15055 ss-10]
MSSSITRKSPEGRGRSTSPIPSPGSVTVDRGRSRTRRLSNPFSEDSLRKRGYHALRSSFGKVFHVEKRWKLVREMGSGAYGVVVSAADEISGETVAIKLVTRIFEKTQLAKRALREITLLRHFSGHENITGLIDVDAITPQFNEIYIFMEHIADLHQIIKSGQTLTNEHVQYFLYQVLRGMKYIHSACVIHRDLKPGNLLVNADCELKLADFGLSRGFDARPDHQTHLTEYVATRWYRAPEIMLAFKRYNTAIDVWSIGCILAELLMGKPLFKGKDYVDQLNKILDVLGTPRDEVIKKIGSEKAQAYVRSLPIKKTVPLKKIIPHADPLALDLLNKMLSFDPTDRITVVGALEHPWLASYHDVSDEPECPRIFDRWQFIEELQTMDEYRDALWNEIEDYRREVRGVNDLSGTPIRRFSEGSGSRPRFLKPNTKEPEPEVVVDSPVDDKARMSAVEEEPPSDDAVLEKEKDSVKETEALVPRGAHHRGPSATTPTDPLVSYAGARRSSILQQQQNSAHNSPVVPAHPLSKSFTEGPLTQEPSSLPQGGIAFPSQGYVFPARSRTGSTVGGEAVPRRLLRTLSTVSIHESLGPGATDVPPIGKYIVEKQTTDAPPSEMPHEFGFDDLEEDEDGDGEEQKEGQAEARRSKFTLG